MIIFGRKIQTYGVLLLVFLFFTNRETAAMPCNHVTGFGMSGDLLFQNYIPFWSTWWFILLTCLLLISGIFFGGIVMVKKIRKEEARKTEKEKIKATNYQYQLEIEQVIHYFGNSISEQKNVDDILWDVVKNCISKLGFEDCVKIGRAHV